MTATRSRFALTAAAACIAVAFATPAAANSGSAEYFRARANSTSVPELLSQPDKEYYSQLFRAIDRENWYEVDTLLAQRNDGPLHEVALAEYYLHANSPRVEAPQLRQWLNAGYTLPQAEQIISLGAKRGLEEAPVLPQEQSFVSQGYATKRIRPRATNDGTMPSSVESAILDHIKNDDPYGARQLLDGIDASLSPSARAEWRQRVAWSFYIENQDPSALAMARTAREGQGPWVSEADWTMGLAAWRLNDCATAAAAFERAAQGAHNSELGAAARYWAHRAFIRCRQPERAAEQLRGAAFNDETLYGMLAREQLGQDLPQSHQADLTPQDWQRLRTKPNVRTAISLAEIGRGGLADDVLRHEARIGAVQDYDALSRLARELGLPSTQLWMAHNAPRGTRSEPALRYPAPRWQPVDGWKVDPALAFAHTLQESNFRASVVSPAGARGLMQIMPAAAKDHARNLGYSGSASDLNDPQVNLAFGQAHLNMLRTSGATQGLLPKVMAAYNAGLSPIGRWNSEVRDFGDPLLYMESIPYWETRGYVAIVMRNYWMYERQANAGSPSRSALAQNLWPQFPTANGAGAVRLSGR